MTTPTDNPKPKPTPRPPKPLSAELKEFSAILTGVRERMDRLDESESILADIHDQLEKAGEVSPFTAARLRIFMEGK